MNMKKILFVISYLDKGGSERALSNLTQNFPSDWEIDILVNSDKVIDYPYKANIISMKIDDRPKTGSVLFQFKVLLKRLRWLKRLKKTGGYDACISFLDSANIANILTRSKKCKTIVSVRNSLKKQASLPQYKYVVNPLVKSLYNMSDKVVPCSRGVERELIDIFRLRADKVFTIENGYDIEKLELLAGEPLDKEFEANIQDKKVVVTVGRLTPQKGQWHLIRAFSEVVKAVPDSVLVIIGTGDLEEYLKKLVHDYNLDDKVIFVGYTDNPFRYEKRADVFAMPSLYEGFPNALAEAVCLGLPCIASDFETGAREILCDGLLESSDKLGSIYKASYGILVPCCSGKRYEHTDALEESEKMLADSIKAILEDDSMRLKYIDNAINRRDSLLISNIVDKWKEII